MKTTAGYTEKRRALSRVDLSRAFAAYGENVAITENLHTPSMQVVDVNFVRLAARSSEAVARWGERPFANKFVMNTAELVLQRRTFCGVDVPVLKGSRKWLKVAYGDDFMIPRRKSKYDFTSKRLKPLSQQWLQFSK